MKLKYLTAIIIFCFLSSAIVASPKSSAKQDIEGAKNIYSKLTKKKEIQKYIPYQQFYDARLNYDQAIHQFEDESEYEAASYYAVLAKIQFSSARLVARTRMYEFKIVALERDYYKKAAKKEMLKSAIISANLSKIGKAYKGVLQDKLMFHRRTFSLTDKKGKKILDKIYDVLELYPDSRILVKGHTKFRDRGESKSAQKANAVAEYLTMVKGLDPKRISTKPIGNSQPMKVGKYMRKINRVEIVITGVRD